MTVSEGVTGLHCQTLHPTSQKSHRSNAFSISLCCPSTSNHPLSFYKRVHEHFGRSKAQPELKKLKKLLDFVAEVGGSLGKQGT